MKIKKIFLSFAAVFVTISSFGFTGLIQKEDVTSLIEPVKEAKAQYCGAPSEIEAGTTGWFSVEIQSPWSGACMPGSVDSNVPGIIFGQQYERCDDQAGWWNWEYSTSYNANNYANITSPQTIGVMVSSMSGTGGECEAFQDYVEITIVPNGWYNQDFNISCSPASRTITAGSSASVTISTTKTGAFNSPVNVTHSISPGGNQPTISYTNNNQIPPATTTANISTTTSTSANTYTIVFTASGGSITKQCSVSLTVNPSVPIVGGGTTQLAVYQTPTATFQINGAASSTINQGQTAVLSWQPSATNSGTACTAGNAWGGAKSSTPGSNYSEVIGPLNTPGTYTYTIQCSGALSSFSPTYSVTLTVQALVPTSDIKANGSDGPITIPYNTAATITWTSTNTTSCTVSPSSWTGVTGSQSTGALTSARTYTLSCTGPGGNTTDSVTVNVTNPSFSINCTPATTTIIAGSSTSYIITVSGQNGFSGQVSFSSNVSGPAIGKNQTAPNITFSPNPSGTGTVTGLVTTSPSTTPSGTYTITITAASAGFANQTCNVQLVINPATPPNPPTNVAVSNSGQCGTIDISWRNSTGSPTPVAYRVYRRISPTDPWQQLGADIPYTAGAAHVYSLRDNTPLSLAGSNYYAVAAVANSVESTYASASPSPIVPVACTPNLGSSDKDVLSVSGRINRTFTPIQCSGTSETAALPNGALYAPGDVVTFQINVCNTGTQELTGVQVTDTFTNLSNMTVLPSVPPGCVTGSSVNANNVTFSLANVAANNGICAIRLRGTVTAPANPTAAIYRFQNRAIITGNGGSVTREVYTPPYLFSVTGGTPDRGETAPPRPQ